MIAPPATPTAAAPKLLDRVRWHLRVKHYSLRTEKAYCDWITRFILFHKKRHPHEMGEPEVAGQGRHPGQWDRESRELSYLPAQFCYSFAGEWL